MCTSSLTTEILKKTIKKAGRMDKDKAREREACVLLACCGLAFFRSVLVCAADIVEANS